MASTDVHPAGDAGDERRMDGGPPRPTADALGRHPHLAAPRPPGWVRVDMHSHTMWSGDSTTTPDELAGAVAAAGLDVLCITDHQTVAGARRLAGELACRVIIGEELRTHAGEIIGLFLTERVPAGTAPRQAAEAIRGQGGIVYVPHPFDPMRRNLPATQREDRCPLGQSLMGAHRNPSDHHGDG